MAIIYNVYSTSTVRGSNFHDFSCSWIFFLASRSRHFPSTTESLVLHASSNMQTRQRAQSLCMGIDSQWKYTNRETSQKKELIVRHLVPLLRVLTVGWLVGESLAWLLSRFINSSALNVIVFSICASLHHHHQHHRYHERRHGLHSVRSVLSSSLATSNAAPLPLFRAVRRQSQGKTG